MSDLIAEDAVSPQVEGVNVLVEVRRGATVWQRFIRNPLALIALAVLVALTVVSFSAPLWMPYSDALNQVRAATFAKPSFGLWFGRDEFGRDAFARAVYGGRISLWVAFSSAILSTAIGTVLGMLALLSRRLG